VVLVHLAHCIQRRHQEVSFVAVAVRVPVRVRVRWIL
jgi:hypothetical protein